MKKKKKPLVFTFFFLPLHSFGWDWGPAFAGMGIWKPIYLVSLDDVLVDDSAVLVSPLNDSTTAFDVEVRVWLRAATSIDCGNGGCTLR